jgi:hypothetical protein
VSLALLAGRRILAQVQVWTQDLSKLFCASRLSWRFRPAQDIGVNADAPENSRIESDYVNT